jgi:hypothetical protein
MGYDDRIVVAVEEKYTRAIFQADFDFVAGN